MRGVPRALVALGIGAALSGAAVLTGCGNSTAPPPPSLSEALHLDTLAQQAAAAGEFDRFRLLLYPVAVLAQGVDAASVSLTVDGATQTYQVAAADLVGTTAGPMPTPSDSVFVVVAWTGDNVSQLVYTLIDPSPSLIDVALLNDTLTNSGLTAHSVSASLGTVDGVCTTLKLATAASLLQGKCQRATVTAAFDLTFAPDSAIPNSHFVLSSQAVPAVRLVLPASNGGQDFIFRPSLAGPTP